MPLSNPADLTALSQSNLVFDAFNQYTTPGTDWSGRTRWSNSASLSIVNPDASNPFGAPTLRIASTAVRAGKRLWLDEMGLQPGDLFTVAALVNAASGTYHIRLDWYNASNVRVGVSDPAAVTITATSQLRSTTVTVPAASAYVLVEFTRDSGAVVLDVYATWAVKGAYVPALPTPTATPTNFWQEIIDHRNVPASNLVFDPFNQYTSPGVDWGGRARWIGTSTHLTLVNPDASNPYNAPTLRASSALTISGKRLWLDEIGCKPGDYVAFGALLNAASGSWYFRADFYNASNVRTGFTDSTTSALSGTAVQFTTTPYAIPAATTYVLLSVIRSSGAVGVDIYAMWGGKGTGYLAPSPTPSVSPTHFWQEIIDARAGKDTLLLRLTGEGDSHGKWLLRNWQAKIAKIQNNLASTQAVIAMIGDSIVGQGNITRPLRTALQTAYGDAGVGYIGIGGNSGASNGDGWTYSRTGTWTDDGATANSKGIDIQHATSTDTATPGAVSITQAANTFVIHHYNQTNGGDFRWRVDGGSWTTVSTNSSAGYTTTTINGLSTASHVLEIQVLTAGSAGVTLMGVDAQKTANGVRLHKIGRSGASTTNYLAVNATNWQGGLALLAPDVVILELGSNDCAGNLVPATFKSNMASIAARILAAVPNCDIVLLAPGDNDFGATYTMAQYADALHSLSREQPAALLDAYALMGAYATANGRGLYSDNVHPNTHGGKIVANGLYNRLLQVD